MKDKLFLWAIRNTSPSAVLPWWATALRAVLYPIDSLYWRLSKTRGYQINCDAWLIFGVYFRSRDLKRLTESKGELFRITSFGDTIVFERVRTEDLLPWLD